MLAHQERLEAARRHDCLKITEVEFARRAQCFGGRGILKVVRQALQPGGILSLFVSSQTASFQRRARLRWAASADHRCAGGPRIVPDVQHRPWHFTDGFGGNGPFNPKRYVTEPQLAGIRNRIGMELNSHL
jgi:hypothetical protein